MSKRASPVCAAAAAGLLTTLSAGTPPGLFTIELPPFVAAAGVFTLASAAVPTLAAAAAVPIESMSVSAPSGSAAAALVAMVSAVMPTAFAAATADDASTDDIRDIRGPKAIFPLALILEWLAGAVLLAAGAFALWRRRRRRQSRALRYFEIALQRLEALRELMHPAGVREFSSGISDVVRRYIEAGFAVTATQQTTEEFLHDILKKENTPLALHRSLLAEFLRQCDLAKFAGMSLSRDDMETLYQSARSFIVGTSPAQPGSGAAEQA